MKPFKISGIVKNYSWGRLLDEALVAKLSKATDRNTRYAELWIGAHPHSPSVCLSASKESGSPEPSQREDSNGIDLISRLQQAPEEMLGGVCLQTFGTQLPFLLKILSIQQPLSIQLHPDLKLASELNEKNAKNYPDKNHKPEIAIAITPVTLLHNIRGFSESARLLERFPKAFKRLVMDGSEEPRLALIKTVLALTREENHQLIEEAKQVIRGLVEPEEEDLWFLKAERIYPKDCGLWFFYILRLLQLQPGEAIFTGAGCLHAYLYGELIECMASSDNTIRAGLTEKFVDVESLLRALRLPDAQSLSQIELGGMIEPKLLDLTQPQGGTQRQSKAVSFQPPVRDFAVTLYEDSVGKEAVSERSDKPCNELNSDLEFHQGRNISVFNLPKVLGPILALNLRGEVWINEGETSRMKLEVGEAAFIPAVSAESSHIKILVRSGKAVLAHGNW